jgi:hypothetical protein
MASNFLLRSMGSTNFMRLSLKKGAHAALSGAACRKFVVFAPRSRGTTWVEQDGAKPFRCSLSRAADLQFGGHFVGTFSTDHHAHEVLLCVQTADSIHNPKRFKFDTDQFYVKSAAEREKLFSHAPVVVSRTMQFAERCSFKFNKVTNPFPEFAVPPAHTIDSYFAEVCRQGFRERRVTHGLNKMARNP